MIVFILVRIVEYEIWENKGVFFSREEAEEAYLNKDDGETWDEYEIQQWEVGKGRIA